MCLLDVGVGVALPVPQRCKSGNESAEVDEFLLVRRRRMRMSRSEKLNSMDTVSVSVIPGEFLAMRFFENAC